MKVSCDIIRDLLPLYAEGLTSQTSNEMVDEHLCECDECTKQLGVMKKAAQVPVEVDTLALKKVRKSINSRRLLTTVTAVLAVLSFVAWFWGFMNVPVYLSADEAIITLEKQEDNALVIDYYDYVSGTTGVAYPGYLRGQICSTTRWRRLSYENGWEDNVRDIRSTYYGTVWEVDEEGRRLPMPADENTDPAQIIDWACDKNWWYIHYSDGTAGELLWDGEVGENVYAYERLGNTDETLLYACIAAAVLGVIFALIARTTKNCKQKAIFVFTAVAGLCYAISSLCITTGQLICYAGYRPQLDYILTLTVMLTATALCCMKLYKLNKQDKAA